MVSTHLRRTFCLVTLLCFALIGCTDASEPAAPASVPRPAESTPAMTATARPEPTDVPAATPLFFRQGLVVTATGADPIANGAVLVEGGLITAVGEESSIAVPENAVTIELNGRTIMPGIVDARASNLLNVLEVDGQGLNDVAVSVFLKALLGKGVTTVRATGWDQGSMVFAPALPAHLQTYGNAIPTVVNAGSSITHGAGSAATRYYPDQTVGVDSVDDARQKTAEYVQLGIDQINILMSSGPALQEAPEERGPVLSLEQVEAIVETAHAQGTMVVAQALFADEAMTVIDAGVDEIASWPTLNEPMPDALLAALVSRSIPVLSGFSVGMPTEGEVRRFLDAGGILVYGTFAPNSGSDPRRELSLMERSGMTPMEIVLAATAHAANAVGLGDIAGTLEPGKRADIVVLDGNPFADGFRSTIDRVVYVVKNGELVVANE